MQPRIIWAQTPEVVFLTIEVPGTTDARLETFDDIEKGTSLLCVDEESKAVHVRLDLFRAVDVTNKQIQSTPRNIQVRLIKKVEETWERLLFEKNSYGNLAVDWDKWVADEDDEEDIQGMLPPNFDMSSLAGMSEGLGMPDDLENESEAGTDDEDDARVDSS